MTRKMVNLKQLDRARVSGQPTATSSPSSVSSVCLAGILTYSSNHPCIHPSLDPPTHPFIHPCIHAPIHLSIHTPIHPLTQSSTHPSTQSPHFKDEEIGPEKRSALPKITVSSRVRTRTKNRTRLLNLSADHLLCYFSWEWQHHFK